MSNIYSSFIVATKNDVTEKELINLIIDKSSKRIKDSLCDTYYYFREELDDEIKGLIVQEDWDVTIRFFAKKLCDILLCPRRVIKLGDWDVRSVLLGVKEDYYNLYLWYHGHELTSERFKFR